MPQTVDAPIEVTALAWVPPFARGHVRDLRVRWALEEVGLSYKTRLVDKRVDPAGDPAQPFAQVPVYREGDLTLFECGAIALHIGDKDERLLPRDPIGKARATTWLLAALNSIDLPLRSFGVIGRMGLAKADNPAAEMLEQRLTQLSNVLGDKQWLEDRFTIGDLMMVATLRDIDQDKVAMPANLAAYVARGEARPAFKAAMAAQLADFVPDEEGVPA